MIIIDEERALDSPFVERMRHTTLTCVHLERSIEHEKSHCRFVYHPRWGRGVAR